jgi:hypothetical protein
MKVHFTDRENAPERLVCEAEIHFEEGALIGTRLVPVVATDKGGPSAGSS